jgi:hypothetical protein
VWRQRLVMGYETREELACEPAKIWVWVPKRQKRGSHCEETAALNTWRLTTGMFLRFKYSQKCA